MSSTTLFKVPERGEIYPYAEFKNSYLGAYTVWEEMGRAYLGLNIISMGMGELRPIWDLWKNEKVLLNDRIVMAATFDRVMVRRDFLPRVATAMDDFAARHSPGHLLYQAEKLRELATLANCFAICWNQTSVNGGAWMTETEERDEYGEKIWRYYDVSKDTDHWFLFDELRGR